MNAAKRLRFLGIAAGSAVLLSALLLAVAFFQGQTASPAESSATEAVSSRPLYTVGAYDNRLAVFRYGETEPAQVLEEVFIRSLPASDQERLRQGISVYTEEELWSLLEDLES